jgi:hypothetical protein
MRLSFFQKIRAIENEDEIYKLRKYDRFLYGNAMIEQKQTKEVGQQITYYEVVSVENNKIEYKPIFDIIDSE